MRASISYFLWQGMAENKDGTKSTGGVVVKTLLLYLVALTRVDVRAVLKFHFHCPLIPIRR